MVGRRAGLGVIVGAAVAALSIVYADDSSSAASTCAAAPVHWEWNARAKGVPWIAAGPAKSRLEGVLFGYRYLGDGRVNRSEGVVLRAGTGGEDRVVLEEVGWQSPDGHRPAARRPRLLPPAVQRDARRGVVPVGDHACPRPAAGS